MVEMFNQANNVVIESSAINVHVNELTSKQTNLIKLREVADWLTPINFRTIQSDTFLKHTPGTGQWFLESQDFSKWISGEQKSLSVLGIPGAGKTILSSIVISHLELYISKNVKAALAYAYFRHNDSYSLSDILAAMIKQLIEGHHIAYAYLEGIYDDYKKKAVRPPVDDLARILRGLIERLGKVYIVVDALDEASEDCRSEFLRVLSNLSISLLTTSRPLDLSRLLPELTVEVRISGQTSYDIESFAARCLKQSHRIQAITKGDQVLQAEILGKLKSKSQGMFLAVSLHADTLSQCTNKKQLMEVAARLPSTLDAIYESTLQRIEAQGPQVARIARSTILWVIYAYQSLRAKVLERAVAISPDKPGFCSDNIIPLELLVTWCCGLVVVDEESNLVRLAHYTTYDFFKSLRTGDFRNPHTSITSSCIAYLQAFDFQNFTNFLRPDWSGEILEGNFFNEDGLYRYAHKFWGKHARCSQVAADLPICVAEFMSSIQEYPILSEEEDEYVFWPTYCTAAYFGLVDVLRIIQDFHCQLTPDGRTSLMLAADRGHFDVVEYILLCQDVDINAIDNAGHTALHLATSEGHGAVVKLLLAQPDIDVNTQGEVGYTALHLAVFRAHETLIKLLLSQQTTNPNIMHESFGTPLMEACKQNREDLVRLLISHPAINFDAQNDNTGTAFQTGCIYASVSIIELFIDRGFDYVLHDEREWELAVVAALTGMNAPVLEFLLSLKTGSGNHLKDPKYSKVIRMGLVSPSCHGVEKLFNPTFRIQIPKPPWDKFYPESLSKVQKYYNDGSTHLHIAAKHLWEEGVKLLLSQPGIDANAKDSNGDTALLLTNKVSCIYSNRKYNDPGTVFRSLLAHPGIDVNAKDANHCTVLHLVCGSGTQCYHHSDYESSIRLLFANPEMDVNAKDSKGKTALHLICDRQGHNYEFRQYKNIVVKAILSHRAVDVNAKDDNSDTALDLLCQHMELERVKLFLSRQEIDSFTWTFPTLFQFPWIADDEEYARSLICRSSVDINAKGKYGNTILHLICNWKTHPIPSLRRVFNLLIDAKIDPNVRDLFGRTALQNACNHGNFEAVRLLLKLPGLEIDRKTPFIPDLVHSAWRKFNIAAQSELSMGNMDVIQALLSRGADINAQDENWQTALHYTSSLGLSEIVEGVLFDPESNISRKIDVNIRNWDGKTALQLALERSDLKAFLLLLRFENLQIEHEMEPIIPTILSLAERSTWFAGDKESGLAHVMVAIRDLLLRGIDVNARDGHGMTALHWACSLGLHPVVELLLSYPEIDVNQKTDHYGAVPLRHVSPKNYDTMFSLFQKAGKGPADLKRAAESQSEKDGSKRRRL